MSNSGVLSVEQAMSALSPEPEPEKKQDATVEQQTQQESTDQPEETQAATTAETSEAQEEPGDGEKEAGEEEASTLEITPPQWWSHDKKARFKELPPDLQAVVFEQEKIREQVVAKSKQEAADAKKAAEAEAAKVQKRLGDLDQILPQAVQTFRSRWANVDWQQLARQVEPTEYNALRAQFEAEQNTVAHLAQQHQTAEEERFAKFVEAEAAKLPEICPELADEKHGPQRKQELGKFLVEMGFEPARIKAMSAQEAALAYDAKRWRDAQKAAATALKQAPKQPAQAKPVVKPSAQASRSPNARIDQLSRKSSLSQEEAIELLNSRN